VQNSAYADVNIWSGNEKERSLLERWERDRRDRREDRREDGREDGKEDGKEGGKRQDSDGITIKTRDARRARYLTKNLACRPRDLM
jgi:hypothetical protein